MILYIEGPRHSGKTFLIDQFIKSCDDSRIEYYKFYFANHIRTLDLVKYDSSPILHYFSLGNIMTIMEMNLREEYKDKIWIFDRAIISAYTWAILRNRLSRETAESEYSKLLNTDLFSNSKTLLVTVDGQTNDLNRNKDTWDALHTTGEELSIMQKLIHLESAQLADPDKANGFTMMCNRFNESSILTFNNTCYTLLGLTANK